MGLSGYLNLSMSIRKVKVVVSVETKHKIDHKPIQKVANVFSSGEKKAPLQGVAQLDTPPVLTRP